MFKAIDQLYANAANVARVDGHMSARFPLERGVAQGCPMSPLLYAIFIDSVLDDLHTESSDDGVPVGDEAWARSLVGHLYADDLGTFATSAAGQQRMLNVVRAHSLRWGWDLNTVKTVIVTFGDAAALAAAADDVFLWGDQVLRIASAAKYLGLMFRADGRWQDQEDAAAKKCLAAFYAWAPALSSRRLPVALKRDFINTRIVPTATYATEVWAPTGHTAIASSVDATLHRARRLAVGIHATASERSWERGTCVSASVLAADFQSLDMRAHCDVAHLRYAEKTRVADSAAGRQRAHDVRSSAFASELPAAVAPDFMGAAVRSGLSEPNPWWQRAADVKAAVVDVSGGEPAGDGALAPRMSNAQIAQGVLQVEAARRLRDSCAVPVQSSCSRAGRAHGAPVLGGEHLNPVQAVLAPGAPAAQYMQAVPEVALPISALRSGHLPGDHALEFVEQCSEGCCSRCGAEACALQELDQVTDVERRWRMVQHHLLHCCGGDQSAQRPPLHMLRDDLLEASAGYPAALRAVRDAFAFGEGADISAMRGASACCVPYLMDPVAACQALRAVGLVHCALVAAYTLAVSAFVNSRAWPTSRLHGLALPPWSRLRRWLLPSPACSPSTSATCISHASELGSDSEDEVWWNPVVLPPGASAYRRACFIAAQEGAEADAPHGQGALPDW